jgi:BirA family biotin operon repressor/biotin-[acetyl-CoA-carboxylase] ligase
MNTPLAPERLLEILSSLADGDAVAPEALATRVGLERDALIAQLPRLADHGVRRSANGYLRIPGGLELLDADRLRAELAQRFAPAPDIDVLGVTGSTNDDARRSLDEGRRAPFAILAEAQSSGRGRRGRSWSSPVASNLYLTLVEPLTGGPESSRGLSLAIGVAVAEGLGRAAGVDPQLKWPNDLLVDGRKLGGILVELAPGPDRALAVIGIGINVRVPDYEAAAIDQAWADLCGAAGTRLSRNHVAVSVLAAVSEQVGQFRERGFDARMRARWQSRDPYFDREIVASGEHVRLAGRGRGIDEHGELLIETASGVERVGAGEVSIRLAEADA